MNPAWTSEFTTEHLLQACGLWGFTSAPPPELFREGESFLYRAFRGEEAFALRITHPKHRTVEQLETELRWIRHMGANAVNVPELVATEEGGWVATLKQADRIWHAVVFRWVPGVTLCNGDELWTPLTFERWGLQLGRMQRLTSELGKEAAQYPRARWDDPSTALLGQSFRERFPEHSDTVRSGLADIAALPETSDRFGLVHGDLHQGNLLCNSDRVTCIDFDDLLEHHFVFDLMIPIYGALFFVEHEVEKAAREIALPLFRGFKAESPLPASAMDSFGTFLAMRDFELLSILDLWGAARDSRAFVPPLRRVEHGNPGIPLPWREWFEQA